MRIYLTDNFYIEQCPYAPFSWDLYLIQTGVRKGETVEVEKPAGCYGISLESIVAKIADYQLQVNGEDLSIDQYIKEFKQIQEQAIEKIKESINQLKKLNQNGSNI